MPFTKGCEAGPGRPKGTGHKQYSNEIKELLQDFSLQNLKKMIKNFGKLNDNQQWKVMAEILPYLLPKHRAVEISGELDTGENLHGHIATKILLELYANRIPENVRKQYESRLRKEIQKNG